MLFRDIFLLTERARGAEGKQPLMYTRKQRYDRVCNVYTDCIMNTPKLFVANHNLKDCFVFSSVSRYVDKIFPSVFKRIK